MRKILLFFCVIVFCAAFGSADNLVNIDFNDQINDQTELHTTTNYGMTYSVTYPTYGVSGNGATKAGDFSIGYMTVTNDVDINNLDDFTVCFWTRPASEAVNQRLAHKIFGGGDGFYFEYRGASTDIVRFIVSRGAANNNVDSTTTLSAGAYNHVCGVSDLGNIKIYVDGGVAEDTAALAAATLSSTSNIFLGRTDAGSDVYTGKLDNFLVFNTALTAAEIQGIYDTNDIPGSRRRVIIQALDKYNLSSINTFNVTFDNSSFFSTTDGNITLINWTNGNYTFNLSAQNYIMNKTTFEHNNNTIINVYLYPDNTLNIEFRDQQNLSIINNITFDLVALDYSQNYVTNNGTYNLLSLAPKNYTLYYVDALGQYASSQYSFSVPIYSVFNTNVTLYLLNASVAETVVFISLDDQTSNSIESDTYTMSRIINGSKVIVGLDKTDVTGRVQFNYQPNIPYYFTSTKTGYEYKSFSLDPIIFTSYDVMRTPSTTFEDDQDFSGIRIDISPNQYYNNRTNNVSIFFLDPEGRLVAYNMSVNNGTHTISDSGNNAYGGYLTGQINISGATFDDTVILDYCYHRSGGVAKCFSKTYRVIDATSGINTWLGNEDTTYGLGMFERIFISVILVIVFMGVTAFFGSAVLGAIVGLIIMGTFTYVGFMPWWASILSIIMLVAFIGWRSNS